jgi:hypothetical protein
MPSNIAGDKLAKLVKTTGVRTEIEQQIRALRDALSTTHSPTISDIQNLYPALYNVMLECYPNTSNKIAQETLSSIFKDLEDIEVVKVDVPHTPTSSFEDALHGWAASHVDKNAIVNVTSSSNILAGVAISYRGEYVNYTLDKIIENKVHA